MRRVPAIAAAAIVLTISLSGPSSARSGDVDESLLQPSLSPTFAPWTCTLKDSGPVCVGTRVVDTGWVLDEEIPCDVPLYNRHTEIRTQIRYYDDDYLNYDRRFRTRDLDQYGTSPDGPAGVSIRANLRFQEPFAVPGDDSTIDLLAQGVFWDMKDSDGHRLLMAVGSSFEPHDGDGTFTGHVTQDGVTARFVDAPLDDILDIDWFFATICEEARG
ncbi:hypothetical protein [Demequina salsinemoris]|uniref:hypothetical protein n=1 Tax=Demequina salsinemoris TaxID=577470 RepID=UPI0007843194|nr:hypothetical protein [Demequina salsinemoris]